MTKENILDLLTEIRDISYYAIANDKPKTKLEKEQMQDLKVINKIVNKIEKKIGV